MGHFFLAPQVCQEKVPHQDFVLLISVFFRAIIFMMHNCWIVGAP